MLVSKSPVLQVSCFKWFLFYVIFEVITHEYGQILSHFFQKFLQSYENPVNILQVGG